MPGGWGTYLLYVIPPFILGLLAQAWVRSATRKGLGQPVMNGMSGAQIARRILDANGLSSVPIEQVPGSLSDHYDPGARTVRLSADVYQGVSVTSTAVAAHEVGHAIQHAKAFAPLAFRTALWKPVSFASNAWTFILFGGFIFGSLGMIKVGIALFAIVVLFQLVTLPVEFDASRRAAVQLKQLGIANPDESTGVRKVLTSAALTYVAGALASLAQLAYFVMVFLGNRN